MDKNSKPEPPAPRGRRRQLFLRGAAWIGLIIYVPAFLIVLLWPGLIIAGSKKLITHEVNRRFEKIGGLKRSLTTKVIGLSDKFSLLDANQSRDQKDMQELGRFVDANAESIIAAFVDEKASELKRTGKLWLNIGHDNAEAQYDELDDPDATRPETDAEISTGSLNEKPTSGTVFSRLKHRFKNRVEARSASDDETTSSPLETLILKVVAGSNGLMSAAVERGRVEIQRMKSAIAEKYDVTIRSFVRELRIFTGSNIILFGFLWLASYSPRVARFLFPFASVLLLATVIFGYLYLVESDWIFFILHRIYLGWLFIVVVIGYTIYQTWDLMLESTVDLLWGSKDDENNSR